MEGVAYICDEEYSTWNTDNVEMDHAKMVAHINLLFANLQL